MATLKSLRDHVVINLGRKSGYDDVIDDNLNLAQNQIVREAQPKESWSSDTFITIANTAEYSLSSISLTAAYAILFLHDNTDDVPIEPGSMKEYNRMKQVTSGSGVTGQARSWTNYGNNVVLYNRIPDDVRTIRIISVNRPTAMTADTSVFPLDDEWERATIELATAFTAEDIRDYDLAARKFKTFGMLLARGLKAQRVQDREAGMGVVFPNY